MSREKTARPAACMSVQAAGRSSFPICRHVRRHAGHESRAGWGYSSVPTSGRVTVGGMPIVVVVTGAGQLGPVGPPVAHESQQLEHVPTVPPLSVHFSALFLVLHLTEPSDFGVQQVTKPGLPQVDFAAHLVTAPLQDFGR